MRESSALSAALCWAMLWGLDQHEKFFLSAKDDGTAGWGTLQAAAPYLACG